MKFKKYTSENNQMIYPQMVHKEIVSLNIKDYVIIAPSYHICTTGLACSDYRYKYLYFHTKKNK